eukprot:CAMPEP_0177640878 /NCGR_PEP_ID=MMETSP0447-20121125/6776_1 /TAXON_ID=0 /ORGANISM="Stygamoeba regulata, Strain BSH-02190019" /LENGTH=546 /DNA_ID=CAMNT_0019142975 /DNA_START=46 /DNA_END=1686 /DNA_ORIENTATION=-
MSSWVDIQQNTFTRWCNQYLKERGMHIDDLQKDFKDGRLLCNLLEIITAGKSVGKYNRNPRIPLQKIENHSLALTFLKNEGIKLVNIGAPDLADGDMKLTLGLIWTLILRYQIKLAKKDATAKKELLEWVQSKLPDHYIKNFSKDWNSGIAVCALVDSLRPGTIPNWRDLDPENGLENCELGINAAYNKLGVPRILDPADMNNPRIDDQSVMTYVAFFRDVEPEGAEDAARCCAYGPGLVEVVKETTAEFFVETPVDSQGQLKIVIRGPVAPLADQATPDSPAVEKKAEGDGSPAAAKKESKGAAADAPQTVVVNPSIHHNKENGIHIVKYTPPFSGYYKVSLTFGDQHIPGSEFTVTVLDEISLGGEGKIRVFYSTTSCTQKGRADGMSLQYLLEAKNVHLRPDFEPWIAVDTMEKEDREAVFTKAGTKTLPIVFIDDKYVGDYDRMLQLEETGKLDALLKYSRATGGKKREAHKKKQDAKYKKKVEKDKAEKAAAEERRKKRAEERKRQKEAEAEEVSAEEAKKEAKKKELAAMEDLSLGPAAW